MASTLDRSLDEIISSSKPKRDTRAAKKPANKVAKVAKATPTNNKKPAAKKANARAQNTRAPAVIEPTAYANKVVVHGLPKDIKNDAVKDFFASQVGGVVSVSLSYNEKGQSKGIATIIFKKPEMAAKAFEKYNGAPIDGGSTKLKLEMVVDPNRKPLIARIQPNQIAKTVAAAKKQQNGRNTNNNAKKAQTKQAPAKKAQAASKKAPKRGKKTVEELDQEMADYFETK